MIEQGRIYNHFHTGSLSLSWGSCTAYMNDGCDMIPPFYRWLCARWYIRPIICWNAQTTHYTSWYGNLRNSKYLFRRISHLGENIGHHVSPIITAIHWIVERHWLSGSCRCYKGGM